MITENEIESITGLIIKKYNPEKIILFGSYAVGNATDESDLDLLVISDKEADLPRYKRGLDIRLLLSRFIFPKDILFYSTVEIKKWKDIPNTLVNNIFTKGKVLYG